MKVVQSGQTNEINVTRNGMNTFTCEMSRINCSVIGRDKNQVMGKRI